MIYYLQTAQLTALSRPSGFTQVHTQGHYNSQNEQKEHNNMITCSALINRTNVTND